MMQTSERIARCCRYESIWNEDGMGDHTPVLLEVVLTTTTTNTATQ